jgi:hypothetical protein
MHGFILTDRTMTPRSPYVSWQDNAAMDIGTDGGTGMDALHRVLPEDALVGHGVPLKPNLALSALYARVREGFEIQPETLFHTLGGFILGRLCGAHICHDTNAAPVGLYQVAQQRMNVALAERLFGRNLVLPTVSNEVLPIGTCSIARCDVTLYPDIGDHQACVLGALEGCGRNVFVNVGTAGLMSTICPSFRVGPFETRPFFSGQYLPTVSGLPGGRHLDVLYRFLRDTLDGFCVTVPDSNIWAKLTTCAAEPALAVGIDFFHGNGYLHGIGSHPTLNTVIASVYQAIGTEYKLAAEKIGGTFDRAAFLGGAADKNPALRSHILRALGLRLEHVCHDSTPRGALRIAQAVEAGVQPGFLCRQEEFV